jgi:hypothetical protein
MSNGPTDRPFRHAGGRTCAGNLALLAAIPAAVVALLVKAVKR